VSFFCESVLHHDRKKMREVCVIGCGVSGLSSAWLLSRDPNVRVTLIEERSALGGHANTVDVNDTPIDTGFLVFNENTYPNLLGLFAELGVQTEPSDMSFAVSLADRSFEWGSNGLGALFATSSNVFSSGFRTMLSDLLRFNREAPAFLTKAKTDTVASSISMKEFLDQGKYSTQFIEWYLVPQMAAVWSAAADEVLAFPAVTFIQFCINHSLAQVLDRPIWRTVSRRSREYIRRLVASLPPSRTTIRLNAKAVRVSPSRATDQQRKVLVTDSLGHVGEFDDVVFGCHPDEALDILSASDFTEELKSALSSFRYKSNNAYLHKDIGLMPLRRPCWSSWNYIGKGSSKEDLAKAALSASAAPGEPCCVSYWLNRLQNLPPSIPELFVTLNPALDKLPDSSMVVAMFRYAHPQYTRETVNAQKRLNLLQGQSGLWFCGAYLGYGFHEDGATSGLRVAHKITGIQPPWWGREMYSVSKSPAAFLTVPTTTSEIFKDVQSKKASGGPYWSDNLGNGGPVGIATRVIQELLKSTKSTPSSPSSSSPEIGISEANDMKGYLYRGPGDVVYEYRRTIGAGNETLINLSSGGASSTTSAKTDDSIGSSPNLSMKRVFKSEAVGAAISSTSTSDSENVASSESSASSRSPTVGELMMAPGIEGGYTGQEAPLSRPDAYSGSFGWFWETLKVSLKHTFTSPVRSFLHSYIKQGCILIRAPDSTEFAAGDVSAAYPMRAEIKVHSWNFYLRVMMEADLGMARSFIAGEWSTDDLTCLFNIFAANRDNSGLSARSLWTSWIGTTINFLSYALQMDNTLAGSRKNISAHYDLSNDLFVSFLDTQTLMYSCGFFETERRLVQQIDLVRDPQPPAKLAAARSTFEQARQIALSSSPVPVESPSSVCKDKNLSISSSGKAVSRVVKKPYEIVPTVTNAASSLSSPRVELLFKGTLEEAQTRKLDHLIARANVQKEDRVLDLGFGWGGLSIRLAETVGCRVHGITLSKEQHDLALERVRARGLDHLITFEIIDYRVFAADHPGEFDKIISVEMVEAVGANYFGDFMAALDRLLAPNGIIVMQAITIPEARFGEYLRTTDFINTIIFPGGALPCIAALTAAMMPRTNLILDTVDQFNLHYAETLRRWRANFNVAVNAGIVKPLGFDDAFIRTWNYYFCYCEAGFATQTLGLQVLTFTRPNNSSLVTGKPSGRLAECIGKFVDGEGGDSNVAVIVAQGAVS
jgi:predicted NAD/FAD-binding protein/cyclopropane fatty-acyl-phospholipid synthase-like methyltransferase